MVVRPISASPWATTVRPGRSRSASGKSSNPTSAVAPKSGPSSRMTAIVVATLPVMIAVAGSSDPGGLDRPRVHHRVQRAAVRTQALAERGGALVSGVDALVVPDVADPPVPVLREVPEGLRDAAAVVGQHGVDADARGRPVKSDDSETGFDLGLKVLMVRGDRFDDDSVHAPTAHGHDRFPLPFLVILGRHGHDGQPRGAGRVLDRPQDRVVVGDVADGRADGAGDAAAQLAGALVGLVFQRRDGLANPLGQRLADRRVPVDDARYGPQGDSRLPGDIDHRRPSRAGDRAPADLAWARHSVPFFRSFRDVAAGPRDSFVIAEALDTFYANRTVTLAR
jgi:hypothetical protein